MFFFAVIAVVTPSAALLAGRLGMPGLADCADWPARMRLGLAAALWPAGADHLADLGRRLPMLPGFVPHPPGTVSFTGPCESAGGFGLLARRPRRFAGLLPAVHSGFVFPAGIQDTLDGGAGLEGSPTAGWYDWVRLCSEPPAVWWALRAAEVIAWPVPGRCAAPAARA